ncbi:hypothetical protein PO124_08135 [Bacillus licheniformis]|nr:hypothetical protein [Bacillus licheniformis]
MSTILWKGKENIRMLNSTRRFAWPPKCVRKRCPNKRKSRFDDRCRRSESNNSNRLAQVSEEIAGTKAYRIGDLSELKLEWLDGVETVAVTAGASTPTPITKEVIRF